MGVTVLGQVFWAALLCFDERKKEQPELCFQWLLQLGAGRPQRLCDTGQLPKEFDHLKKKLFFS